MTDERLTWLEGIAHTAGVQVHYAPLQPGLNGCYIHRERIIKISSNLSAARTVATLAHELMHALHNHEGPQPDSVEARVDRMAARLLVSPSEYAEAERLYGPHAGAIAKELDLPLWVVRAWQAQAHPMRLASSASRCSEECW